MYPKKAQPLSEELFRNPTSEYRGTPFWAWNCKLEKDELLRQIDVMQAMGFGGFHMHARTGMATEYLGDEYMELIKSCVEKARSDKMLAWLYDEDRWPSGAAGGFVTKDKKNRLRHLLLTRKPYSLEKKIERVVDSSAISARTENGFLIACFDVCLNSDGNLAAYRQIGADDLAEGFKLYAYAETAEPGPWYNNQTYADTLNPDTIAEFIRITYDRYLEFFADDFGSVVPAIFTDEPQFAHKTTLGFAHDNKDVTIPWTIDLPETFASAYPGDELVPHLPELLWEKPDGVSRIRYLYHDHVAERFAQAFADQCGDWCQKHGIMLTGHMMEEPTLQCQTKALGEAMRSYRGFQLPGIDMLCDRYEYTTAKQAQSASRQHGNPGVLSELYGVTNWDYDFRGHKIQGDWQAALGVTVRVPHLSWVSMNGEAKRDYPGTFNYQAPWHTEYALIENHFARINTAMTRGKPIVRIGVIHPIESYWLHWGAEESTRSVREHKDEQFMNLTNWLISGLMDFDFIAESLLPSQCDISNISGIAFPVGQMSYDAVIVPGCETLRSTTLERLEHFRNAGGKVIFMGPAPRYQDAYINDRGNKLHERSERIEFERLALLDALSGLREIDIFDSSGGRAENLVYQLREETDCRWLFVAHAKAPANKDVINCRMLKLRLAGEWAVTLYNTLTGDITPIPSEAAFGFTAVSYPFYDHDSLLLRLTKEPTGEPRSIPMPDVAAKDSNIQRWIWPVPITLEEPNVLLFDMAEYKLGDEEYRPLEEILRLDNVLRQELSWPSRMEAVAQPWVESDETTPHIVTLRFTFESNIPVANAKLALERPDIAFIRLNGASVPMLINGWYVDKSIQTVDLPDLLVGKNTIEVIYLYGRKVDLEYLYLLGDFGVSVAGTTATLTEPVRELAFGDITRQGLPFYGGNIIYHLEAATKTGEMNIEASNYRGHLLNISIDGEKQGKIIFSPYRLAVKGLEPGKHKVDIKYFGNRINTFGQLHCVIRDEGFWWGPNSWRTTGEAWSYEYKFWPQGIMKSPEITA